MKKLCLLLGAIAVLGACKKDSDSDPSPATSRTDLLTAKPWQASTVNLSLNGVPLPSSQVVSACQLDNTYKFNADKTLVVDEGATKCNTTDPQTQTGTWAFTNNDQNKLTIAVPNSAFNGNFDIKALSSSTLQLTTTQSLNGLTYTIDATFGPK
ncbi:MAG: hypothetical protein EOO62_37255 [Hymenobacter sp.]|nr:MAG: hypothetical protein EOO62_37255 [Hymenobacter sp.]